MRVDIVDYEGIYQVDTDGNIISIKFSKERILKPGKNKKGYLQVNLWKNGKKKRVYVHRIVAQAFIPNPENKAQVNHKNGIKTDNRIENLEWVTSSENTKHAFATGLKVAVKGEKNGRAKHPDSVIHKIFEMNKQGYLQKEIAKEVGYSNQQISKILNGKSRMKKPENNNLQVGIKKSRVGNALQK